MKLYLKLFTITLLLGIFISGCTNSKNSLNDSSQRPIIGMVVGTFDDTWRSCVRNEVYKDAEGKAQVDIWSGDDSQQTENQKIDSLIRKKVKALVINLVEPAEAGIIIEKAKKANIPVIFFNVQPSSEDLQKWDKAYYVGAKAEQSGSMQGQILVKYFKSHPPKDGVIDYVMLKGPAEHQDARLRTQYSIKGIDDAGLKASKLADDIAQWDRTKGQEKMAGFLASQGDRIDCVIANNDNMALGAIDALKTKGYFQNGKYMLVVGVDATNPALKALKDGSLLGTVLNDYTNQGKAIFNLAYALAQGKNIDQSNVGYPITDGKYIWIDYKIITKENINDAK